MNLGRSEDHAHGGVRSARRRVAYEGMDVRIGITATGELVTFDTASTRPLLLVGDSGRGKTTICRYLTRWWLADTDRHAHVFTPASTEWADLRCHRHHLDEWRHTWDAPGCVEGSCLIVIDEAELFPATAWASLPLGKVPVLLTARDASLIPLPRSDVEALPCVGLICPDSTDPVELAVQEGQTRLDWPCGTTVVIADQRSPLDAPCHRWNTPTPEWVKAQ